MLQTIREKLTGWFAILILGAIALTLVITFGNIDTGFTPASTAATVNGEEVPVSEFRAIYQQQRLQWEANFRSQIPPELAESMANSVIDSIVRNRSLSQHVQDAGYRVNDAEVIAAIQSNTVFHVGGQFSQLAYEQLLRSQNFTPQRFEYEQRQNMELQQFVEGVAFSAFFTPAEFRRYIELDGELRDFEYVLLPASTWESQVEISDEAIEERYTMDQDMYRTTETADLEYIEVKFADLLASTEIDEADARAYFDGNPQEFNGPADRSASHILLAMGDDEAAAEQRANEVAARLAAGEDFATLAAEYSDDTASASQGGALGWLGPDDTPAPAFEDALFGLAEVGDVSAPVRTEFGYHLIRLDGMREGTKLSFDAVAEELIARLREDAAADRYAELLDELDERALESLDGLGPVAQAMGLELKTLAGFTRNGGGDLGFSPDVVDTVFSLEVLEDGENSSVVQLEDDRAVVLRVTDHQPSEVRPLAEVREEVLAQLVQEDALALGAIATAETVAQLNKGVAPADALGEGSAPFASVNGLRRGDAEVPPDLAAEVFRAPLPVQGKPVYVSKLLGSGAYAIFRVTGAQPGRPESFTLADRDLRKEQLSKRLGGGHATAIVETLVNEADVVVTPDLIANELGTL